MDRRRGWPSDSRSAPGTVGRPADLVDCPARIDPVTRVRRPFAPRAYRNRRGWAVAIVIVGLLAAPNLAVTGLRASPPLVASEALPQSPWGAPSALAAAETSLAEGHGPAGGAGTLCGPASAPVHCLPASGSAAWTNLSASVAPDSNGASMAFDSTDGYVLLFEAGTTWTFSEGTWTNRTSSVSTTPTSTNGLVLADDPRDGYVVGFGGEDSQDSCDTNLSSVCNSTWAYSGGDWREVPTQCDYLGRAIGGCGFLQFPRASLLMAYDPIDRYVFLSSQTNGSGPAGQWSYSNGTWTDRNFNYTTNSTIFSPAIGALAYDAADGYLLGFGTNGRALFGPHGGDHDDTWSWSHNAWTNLTSSLSGAPPPRFDPALSEDAADGYVVLYGGWGDVCLHWNGPYCASRSTFERTDTWEFGAGGWLNLSSGSAPGADAGAAATWDPIDGTVLLVAGWDCPTWYCPGTSARSVDIWGWGTTPPIVGLQATVTSANPEVAISVNFTAAYEGGTPPIAFNWAFGDGNHSAGAATLHAFSRAGSYVAMVWANDSAGHRAVASVSLNVTGRLSLGVSASPNPTDAGTPVQFDISQNGGTGPYAYAWLFGDGTSSSVPEPVHVYSIVGLYTAELWVNDSGEASNSATVEVYVHPGLSVTSVTATPDPAPLGAPVQFSGSAIGGVLPYRFAWGFGDGGTGGNLANITHIFTTDGPFVATFTVSDAAGSQASGTVNLTIALNASILSNASLGAAPLAVGFTSLVRGGTPGYAYEWQFDDGDTSAVADPSHTYLAAGHYLAHLTVTDVQGRSAVSAWPVTVAAGGGPLSLVLSTSATEIPLGGVVEIAALPSGGSGLYSFQWTGVPLGCSLSSPLSLNCTWSTAGAYQIQAALTDAFGHSTVAAASVSAGGTVAGGPAATPSVSGEPWGEILIASVAVGGLLVAAVLGTGRRGRDARTPPPSGGPDRYAEYRNEGGTAGDGTRLPEGTASADPLDDLF